MKKIIKIRNGGIYLIRNNIGIFDPEYKGDHYYLLVKTSWTDLYLGIPLTTSSNRRNDSGTLENPIDSNETFLFFQTKIISKKRVISPKKINGIECVLTPEELETVEIAYSQYLKNLFSNGKRSTEEYHKSKTTSFDNMELKCHKEITIKVNSTESLVDLSVISYKNITPPYLLNDISLKKTGTFMIEIALKDSYEQKITETIKVNII